MNRTTKKLILPPYNVCGNACKGDRILKTGSIKSFDLQTAMIAANAGITTLLGYDSNNQQVLSLSYSSDYYAKGVTILSDGRFAVVFEDETTTNDTLRVTMYKYDGTEEWTINRTDRGYGIDITHTPDNSKILVTTFTGNGSQPIMSILSATDGSVISGFQDSDFNYFEADDVYSLPDGRFVVVVDNRQDNILVLDENLNEMDSIDPTIIGETGWNGNPTFVHTAITPDSKYLYIFIGDDGDADSDGHVRRFDLNTYEYDSLVADYQPASFPLHFDDKHITVDSNRVYFRQGNSGVFYIYDLDLTLINTVDLNTDFNGVPFTDGIIENLYAMDENKIVIQVEEGDINTVTPVIWNNGSLEYFGNQDQYSGFSEYLKTRYFNNRIADKTLTAPTVSLDSYNATSATISWTYPSDEGIDGFDLYLDGVKQNGSPIDPSNSTGYTISGLSSTTEYEIHMVSLNSSSVVESPYSNEILFTTKAPIEGESFENYSLGAMPTGFTDPGDANATWEVTDQRAYAGSKSLGSQNITDNQTAAVEHEITLGSTTTISFHYLPSTENNYDFFRFYIDGVEEFAESGEFNKTADTLEFKYFEKSLAAGTYILRFEMTKDGSASDYDDRCYIDNLVTS